MIIAVQGTYLGVDLGLYDNATCIAHVHIDKKRASADLIPTLDTMLGQAGSELKAVELIVVNQGPAPFTTLRTVIATINGIAFAAHVPLLGVTTFEAIMHNYDPHNQKTILVLLNAYAKEYYYGLKIKGAPLIMGTCRQDQLPTYIGDDTVHILGQIETVNAETIKQYHHSTLVTGYNYATLDMLVHYALKENKKGDTANKRISPLYLKNYAL